MAHPTAFSIIPRCTHCASAGDTYSEEFRHLCEVRHVLSLKREDRLPFCDGVGAKRGPDAARRLIDDVSALHAARKSSRLASPTQTALL
jgi:hypothetical protein